MKEQYKCREESELKLITTESSKNTTKENEYLENSQAAEDKISTKINGKPAKNEDFKTKSTEVTYNPFLHNTRNTNISGNNSSPKNDKSKHIFSHLFNAPIKNMDLSPFKNFNYANNSDNNPLGGGISNLKMNLNLKLEHLKNSDLNKNIFQQAYGELNFNSSLGKSLITSPKFYNQNLNMENSSSFKKYNNSIDKKIIANKENENNEAEKITQNRVLTDIKNGISINNNPDSNNLQYSSDNKNNNKFLNSLSRNFEFFTNSKCEINNNSYNLYAPNLNFFRNPIAENNLVGKNPNCNLGLVNINNNNNFNLQISFSNISNANNLGMIKPYNTNSENLNSNNNLINNIDNTSLDSTKAI